MSIPTGEIIKKANRLIKKFDTRDPKKLCQELGINLIFCPFKVQKGAYKVLIRNRFIFVKSDLDPVMEKIVIAHEIGHDMLHRKEASALGGFQEFEIFDMKDDRMEYEANIFASQLSLPDEEFLEYIEKGYDAQMIASAMNSCINLVALKADTLIAEGYRLRPQEHRNDFLKYNER